jgi:hypothetical protein
MSADVSNQLSNDRPRQRRTTVYVSGSYFAAYKENAKARAADKFP